MTHLLKMVFVNWSCCLSQFVTPAKAVVKESSRHTSLATPAKAGPISPQHEDYGIGKPLSYFEYPGAVARWVPAFAGMTTKRMYRFYSFTRSTAGIQGRQGSATDALDPRFRGGDDYSRSRNFIKRE
jgi:hypothetical protein